MFLSFIPFFQSSAQVELSHKPFFPELYNDDGDGFVVIAHRGASAYYPENTMIAFRKSIELGAEMIELDVLMSKDGVPIVFHDAKLDKKTNGKGSVGNFTVSELKQLDAGSWFDEKFKGERIPTLDEVLAFAKGKIALNIEIKTEAVTDVLKGGVEEKSIQLVRKHGMEKHVIFSSFDYRAVAHLKELAPDISTALLYTERISGKKSPVELVNEYSADAFNCHYAQLSAKWMNSLKESDIPAFVYTVNSESRMRSLIEIGVKGIFSDKPDVLKRIVQKLRAGH